MNLLYIVCVKIHTATFNVQYLHYLSDWGVDDGARATRPRLLPVRGHPVVERGRRLGAALTSRNHEHHGLLGVEPQLGVLEPMRSMLLLLLLLFLMEVAGRLVTVALHGTSEVGLGGRRRR